MPHDVGGVMSGTLVLWVGWYGFNIGSATSLETIQAAHAAANAAVATTVSGSMGALTAVALALLRGAAIGGRSRSVDAVSLANGLLSGLVAITAASDVVTVFDAALIGVGSAGAYMFASALSEAFYLDDVVEAGAVHAGCGVWSAIAAGLFHPEQGLLYTGSWELLGVQIVGVTAIAAVAFSTTLVVALALNNAGMLRVSAEEEAKGLDHKFGIAASSFHYHRAERIRECATVIESSGGSISELIEALQEIKNHIILPFNPHASDLVLEGQVTDALSRLDISFSSSGVVHASSAKQTKRATKRFGDYVTSSPLRARIATATSLAANGRAAREQMSMPPGNSLHGAHKLERKLTQAAFMSNSADNLAPAPEPAPAESASGMRHLPGVMATPSTESDRETTPTPRTSKKPIKWLAFLSHHKQDGGDAARVFVDTARRVFGAQSDLGSPGGMGTLSSIASSLQEELIFLDSSNLSDLRRLLDHVEESANYILMLTRSTLERPWVLAELVRAHQQGKRMLVISVAWPGDDTSPQGRGFKFPTHLDEAIDEWQEYLYESSLRLRAMSEASERESRLAKIIAGSILLQRLKTRLAELLRNQQERPSNASTWLPERWELSSMIQESGTGFTRAVNAFRFRALPENEA